MPASTKRSQLHQSAIQSTNDLRSHATDLKREIEFKHKWSPAWAGTGMPIVKIGPNDTKRPMGRPSKLSSHKARRGEEKLIRKNKAEGKLEPSGSGKRGCTTIESSTDDDELSSQTSEPELEGDGDGVGAPQIIGHEILGLALTKAVERYDHQTLVKLVKEEYEVLDGADEDGHGVKVAQGDFDDDFELV